MPNPYCEVLGIDVPTLARIEGHPKASTWSRFLVTLMAEGGPLTLEQAAARFEAAGLGARGEALRALKRCQPGRRPVYRHGERYFLDPHDHEADMWAFRLGLRPPRGAGAADGAAEGAADGKTEDDPGEATSAREDAAAPEPAPLPGPAVPLRPAELEELWSEVDLSRWSAQRVALCVLEAYGAPMAPAEVVERVEALHGPGHRFVADQPHFERRNSAVRVLEDGRWAMVPEHRSIRLARETVRKGIQKLREQPAWMRRESAEEIAARQQAWQARREADGLVHARLRRAILRGWPVEAPRVLAVYDVDREGAEIFFDDEIDAAKRELERYDVWAGEEIRPLLEGLGIDFAARRLHELRPPQKTIKRNDRGDTLEVTMARLLAGSCGIERRWADATTVDRWIDRERWAQLRDALEAEVEDLAALYRYGRLHRALRIRWYSLDEMVEVPWVHWDEWSMHSYIRRAVEATQPLEVVAGTPARGGHPWADARWCWLYSGEGYRDTLVDAHHAVVQHEDVQRLRAAVPGAWHAPLPAEAAGPSVAGLAERERRIRPPAHILRVRIELDLQGMAPNPWRRIELPAEASFWDVHVAIQNAMGWTDSHLHAFLVRDPETEAHIEVGLPQVERFSMDEPVPLAGWTTPLLDYLNPDQPHCDYQYDFGDDWRHRVTLEAIAPRDPDETYPRCLEGARACPPEDVGGPHGFQEFLVVLADPTHDLHEQYVTWSGGAYDPAAFDAHAVHFEDSGRRWVEAWGAG